MDPPEFRSRHFTLRELLRSQTAERTPSIQEAQYHPPEDVMEALQYHVGATLDPLRSEIGGPVAVSSGYRCPTLNAAVGGSEASQHVKGEASDIHAPGLATSERQASVRRYIAGAVERRIDMRLRPDLTSEGLLFAYIVLNLHRLDVDQVIHEYGQGWGLPAWVHVSSSRRQDRREILAIGAYTSGSYVRMTPETALERLCVTPSGSGAGS